MEDKIAETLAQIDMSEIIFPIIAVYGPNQIEYPGKYVARVFNLTRPTNAVVVKATLEELQNDIKSFLSSKFLGAFISRSADDDPL